MVPSPTAQTLPPIADQGCFFVGGDYVDTPQGRELRGQMYVEYQVPDVDRLRGQIVLIHGKWQSGVNFITTPDGRPGWGSDFLRRGYAVYIVDQVGRGRSPAFADYGGYFMRDYTFTESMFTGTADFGLWPQAQKHTQWPGGSGRIGNPAFDHFAASWIPSLDDSRESEDLNTKALIALLDRIGPSVLLTHSQSGAFGWRVGDARPELVQAIIATECGMVPFQTVKFNGEVPFYTLSEVNPASWGLTLAPLTFDPPLADPSDLSLQPQPNDLGPDFVRGLVPTVAARLTNLAGIPICIVTAEASYHATFDHLIVAYLRNLGVEAEQIELGREGLRGNGHMLMLESNSAEIAELLANWTDAKLMAL